MLYPDGSGTFHYQENFLVEPSQTAGMALDFIDADTLYNQFLVSSKTTGILGYGADYESIVMAQ